MRDFNQNFKIHNANKVVDIFAAPAPCFCGVLIFCCMNFSKILFKVLTSKLGSAIIMTRKLGNRYGGTVMNKEEILEKAQAEKRDEREVFLSDKSIRWTYLAIVLLTGIFTVVRGFRDQASPDLLATLCLSVSVGHIYRYIKTKDKFYLLVGICSCIVGAGSAVQFFIGY